MCHQPSGFRTRVDGAISKDIKLHLIMIVWFVNSYAMGEIEWKLFKE